jgi:hypothetical protein
MSEAITWDDLEQMNGTAPQKPFFAIDLSNDDEVLRWLKQELMTIKNARADYLEKSKNNYLRYKGYQYLNAVYYPRDVLESKKQYTPQVVLPLISDAIDEKTSRLLELKPSVVILPVHDESKDKVDVKIAKRFLSHIDNLQKLDGKFQKIIRNSQVTGESFLWTRWNPDLGDQLKETKIAQTEDGKPIQERISQGDVEVVNKTVNWVFYELAESWEKVNYCYIVELDYVDALKLDYPHLADKIAEDAEAKVFNFETLEQISISGKCRKITFYHRHTKYLSQGFEAVFVNGALLKKGPLSYEHGELPIDRLVDIENDEEIAGQSSIDKVRGIASNVNNLLNSIIKMFMLAGYAKWFVEAGAVDEQQLNNDVNIVKVKQGAKAPVLAQANPVGQQHFSFMEQLKGWFYDFMKSNSVIRGEPPAGVTAGVALQYVSESESRRMRTSVSNFNTLVRSVYDKILKTAGQYYKPDDERTIMVMGKDNRWENYPLDVASIAKPYSVMIQNTSGLSDSKAVRTQQLIDLNQQFPGAVPQEQVLEMTGLAQGDKFYDVGSAAIRAAEDENEFIQDGKGQIEPAEWEEHISHWKIHVQSMQALGFKTKAGPEITDAMVKHITATEMLMMDQALQSPGYAQALLAIPQFPMFFEPPVIDPMAQPGMAMPDQGPVPQPGPPPAPPQGELPQQQMM